MESELSVTGRRCSLTVYHAGTCSDMIPVYGRSDDGVNDMVKMASITASFSDELSNTRSDALMTDCWKAAILVLPSTAGSLFRSQPT